ncbi:MAG: ABC transporter substrate-binding protein [Chloroflexi bacterium]|nr:ABC transporter substrate-binding protein [Chloroflexota bacterium]
MPQQQTGLVSRRMVIGSAAVGGLGLAGAALIGCSSSAPATPSAGDAKTAVTSSASGGQPKSGGTFKTSVSADIETLDRYRGKAPAGWNLPSYFTGSRLLQFDNGKGRPAKGNIIADLAEKWEQPDPQTIVFHLNQAAKFDGRAPTSGRAVTSEDVVQSWKRYASEAAERKTMSHAANKDASIIDITAIDKNTVQAKLAFPDALVISQLAGLASIWVQPVEGITGKFDLAKDMRGTGPFMLEEYRRSVGFTFARNPNWHLAGAGKRPYLDKVNVAIIPERAQTEAQFRAKNLHAGAVSQQNIPQFSKELPGTQIVTASHIQNGALWGFTWADGQPWHDVRIRRALSMAVDRDTFGEVIFDPGRYKAVGVNLNLKWNTPLGAGWGDFWLDPKGKDAGPGGAFMKHNVAEAKKLMAAAGYSPGKPLNFDVIYPGVKYGLDWPTRAETIGSMASEVGFQIRQASIDYTKYVSNYWRGGAKFKGETQQNAVQFPPGGAAASTALEWCISYFTSKGVSSAVADKFPELEAIVKKTRTLADFEAQRQGIYDIQRYTMENMITLPIGPVTESVDLIWKGLHGPGEINGWPGGFPVQTEYRDYWMEGER